MELSTGSEKFTFGEVEDTQYVPFDIVNTQLTLPYNPFFFDLQLTILKSKPNYEEISTTYPLSRTKKTVFCRKKKIQKEWTDPSSVPIYLNAEIVSEKHFSINQKYVLRDEGSKHGTYFWVDRLHPLKLQFNQIFLIGKQPLVITRVSHQPKTLVQFTYHGQTTQILDQRRLYLIGSHPKCDLRIPTLHQFQICINLSNLTIFTYLDEQQSSPEHGLWLKIRSNRPGGLLLIPCSLILVDPYIFRVTS